MGVEARWQAQGRHESRVSVVVCYMLCCLLCVVCCVLCCFVRCVLWFVCCVGEKGEKGESEKVKVEEKMKR